MKQLFQYPTDSFSLLSEEKVETVIRHHWIVEFFVWIRWFFWGPMMIGLAAVLIFLLMPEVIYTKGFFLTLYFSSIVFLFFSIGSYLRWLNQVFDILIVTTERVISVNQIDFFHKSISETRLHHIQDVKGSLQGVLNTFFNWGSLTIMTASNTTHIVMHDIQDPSAKSRLIFTLVNKYKANPNMPKEDSLHEKIVEDTDYQSPFFQHIRTDVEAILSKK